MKLVWDRLWPELRVYKRRLLLILFIGALTSGLKALTPELTRQLEGAWSRGDHRLAYLIPLIIAGVWILASIGRFFHLYWMKYISDLISVNLRRQLMNKYLGLNLSFYQSFITGSGGLISRMLNDIHIIQDGSNKVADLLREPFLALFAFAYLVYIDWKLTLFVLIAMPIITSILRKLAISLRKYGHQNQEAMEDLTKTLKESLDGTRIVQSFNLEGEMRRRFEKEAAKYLASRKKIIAREQAGGPVSESLAAFTLALILIYIGIQIFAGHLGVGDFLGFAFAIGLLQDSIKKLQDGYIKIQQTSVALDRMYKILEDRRVVPQSPLAHSFPDNWKSIEFRNVSFAFDQEPILQNINLRIQRGEVVALVGPSGGGKSTLVNLLSRFFDPSEGQILIDDVPLSEIDLKELRDHVALVSQDVFLFSDTVERNIHAGNFSKDPALIPQAARLANAHQFIERSPEGYQTRVGEMGSNFSGGEKQRLSIARALFKDAPILILDEATSALDSESEQEVQKGLDSLLQGRTAFVVAHRLSTITKADRILVLKKGQIVEEGKHQDLLSQQGEYFRFHQLQAGL